MRHNMKIRLLLGSAFSVAMAVEFCSAYAIPLPGTPTGGVNFGTVDITDGINILPGPVTPGDLVLLERPTGGTGRDNWSNVIRYYNFTNPFGFGPPTVGYAYHMSDSESGIPVIQLRDIFSGNQVLPDSLDANNTFRQETQMGFGTAADITPYVAADVASGATATYNVHSDAALAIEGPETVVVQPGGPIGGNKQFMTFSVNEVSEGPNVYVSPFALMPGVNTTVAEAGDAGALDTFTFAANPLGGTIVTITSEPLDGSPGFDIEKFFAAGDETFTSGALYSSDIAISTPEPSSLLLLSAGLGAVCGFGLIRRRKPATA